MIGKWKWSLAVLVAALMMGCEGEGDDETAAGTQEEWDAIEWLTGRGPDCKGAVEVFALDASLAGNDGVYFSYDSYPWSDSGLVHFFVWQGDHYKGGKFDWIRDGGQTYKGLENVHSGYNGHDIPASGTRVAFAWTTSDGGERSNLIELTWP